MDKKTPTHPFSPLLNDFLASGVDVWVEGVHRTSLTLNLQFLLVQRLPLLLHDLRQPCVDRRAAVRHGMVASLWPEWVLRELLPLQQLLGLLTHHQTLVGFMVQPIGQWEPLMRPQRLSVLGRLGVDLGVE